MLLFKKKFLDAIRNGTKTQTIRMWKRRMLRAGQMSYIPGAGYIRIVAVDAVALDTLTDDDAQPDGFASIGELRREIDRIYPQPWSPGLAAYRIRFERLSESETNDYLARRRADRPH